MSYMRVVTLVIAAIVGFVLGVAPSPASASPPLEELVRQAVQDAAPWPDVRVEVDAVRVVGKIPEGPHSVELRDTRQLAGTVRAELLGGDAKVWISARVEVFVPVVVATSQMERGEPVGPIALEERPLTGLPRDFATDVDAFLGVVARRTIRTGDVVKEGDVQAPVVIVRNQMITLIARRGAVIVTARGVAMSRARTGELVRVRNMVSNTITEAVAVRPGLAEVP